MPTYFAKPAYPTFRRGHPLLAGGNPLLAPYPSGPSSTAVRDLMGLAWTVVGGVTSPGGAYGPAWKFNGSTGYLTTPTVPLPDVACTILAVISAPDSAAAGAAFAPVSSTDRLTALIPYSGVVYWDFGGNGTGSNRLTWTPAADWFGPGVWHAVALRAGGAGLSIWSDGVLVASSSTAVTRAAGATGLDVGAWSTLALYGDNAIASLEMFPREIPDDLLRDWSADPYEHVRPRPATVVLVTAALAGGGGAAFRPAWAMPSNTLIGAY